MGLLGGWLLPSLSCILKDRERGPTLKMWALCFGGSIHREVLKAFYNLTAVSFCLFEKKSYIFFMRRKKFHLQLAWVWCLWERNTAFVGARYPSWKLQREARQACWMVCAGDLPKGSCSSLRPRVCPIIMEAVLSGQLSPVPSMWCLTPGCGCKSGFRLAWLGAGAKC